MLDLTLLSIGCVVILGALSALHVPAVMNYQWTALAFAIVISCVLTIVATFVADRVAALPLFALILVIFFFLKFKK